jgi:hypothetical protein
MENKAILLNFSYRSALKINAASKLKQLDSTACSGT